MPLLFFFIILYPIKDGPEVLGGGEITTAAAMTHPPLIYDIFSFVSLKQTRIWGLNGTTMLKKK